MIEINQDRVNDAIWIYEYMKDAAIFDYNMALDAVQQAKQGNMFPIVRFASAVYLGAFITYGIVGGRL